MEKRKIFALYGEEAWTTGMDGCLMDGPGDGENHYWKRGCSMLLMRLPLVGGKSALSGWQGFPRRVYPRRRIPSPPRPPCWPPMPRCAREETIYPRSSFGRSRTGESMLVSPFLRVGHLPHGSLQNPGDPGHRSSPLRAVVPGPSRVASPCPWPIIPRDVAKHGWQKRKEKSATPLSGVTSNPHGERCLHVSFEHMRSPPSGYKLLRAPQERSLRRQETETGQ